MNTEPYDVRGSAKLKAMIASLHENKTEAITAKMLDAAGVVHWQERLRDASLLDEEQMRPEMIRVHIDQAGVRTEWDELGRMHGPNWDRAWELIKAEFRGEAPTNDEMYDDLPF